MTIDDGTIKKILWLANQTKTSKSKMCSYWPFLREQLGGGWANQKLTPLSRNSTKTRWDRQTMTTFKWNITCCAWPKKIMLTMIKFHKSDKELEIMTQRPFRTTSWATKSFVWWWTRKGILMQRGKEGRWSFHILVWPFIFLLS